MEMSRDTAFETEGKLISLGVDVGNLWGLVEAVGLTF